MGRQHQGIDRPEVQVPEGSGEQRKVEETGCKVICGAPKIPAVKGQVKKVNAAGQQRGWVGTVTIWQCPQTTIFEERGELTRRSRGPPAYQPARIALTLGLTG